MVNSKKLTAIEPSNMQNMSQPRVLHHFYCKYSEKIINNEKLLNYAWKRNSCLIYTVSYAISRRKNITIPDLHVLTSQWGFTRPPSIYLNLGKVRDNVSRPIVSSARFTDHLVLQIWIHHLSDYFPIFNVLAVVWK